MKVLFALFFVLCVMTLVYAQTPAELTSLQQKFRSFDYDGVIELANEFLTRRDQYTPEQLVSIYEMKAIAHYSKSQLDAAEYAFEAILKIDPTYSPDSVNTSPKIITFFESVKKKMEQTVAQDEQIPDKVVVTDTLTIVQETLGAYRKSIPASLLLPGSGHLLMGDKKRGFVLSAASLVTLSSAIYFTNQTRSKEKDYMNATDEDIISSSYSSYNNAYKTRNALWLGFAAVWVYSQTDLIFFHEKRQKIQVVALPSFSPDKTAFLSLSLLF